jgi:uncharacterized protein YajQ (UPF0234 family)
MPSVDVVSRVDFQAMDNAVNNAKREIATRYDFKGVPTEVVLDRKARNVHVSTGDEGKLRAVIDMLQTHAIRQKVDPRCFAVGAFEPTTRGGVKADIGIREGLSQDIARDMVKTVKGTKLKVQAAIQEHQVRLSGKKIDELQALMRLFREKDYDLPLQFVNMKND